MKRVYTSELFPLAGHVKEILEAHGIDCVMRNDYLSGAAGELPPNECWPEVWVIDDGRYAEALTIVEATTMEAGSSTGRWTCPACHEQLEGQFTDCWRCSTTETS